MIVIADSRERSCMNIHEIRRRFIRSGMAKFCRLVPIEERVPSYKPTKQARIRMLCMVLAHASAIGLCLMLSLALTHAEPVTLTSTLVITADNDGQTFSDYKIS